MGNDFVQMQKDCNDHREKCRKERSEQVSSIYDEIRDVVSSTVSKWAFGVFAGLILTISTGAYAYGFFTANRVQKTEVRVEGIATKVEGIQDNLERVEMKQDTAIEILTRMEKAK